MSFKVYSGGIGGKTRPCLTLYIVYRVTPCSIISKSAQLPPQFGDPGTDGNHWGLVSGNSLESE